MNTDINIEWLRELVSVTHPMNIPVAFLDAARVTFSDGTKKRILPDSIAATIAIHGNDIVEFNVDFNVGRYLQNMAETLAMINLNVQENLQRKT